MLIERSIWLKDGTTAPVLLWDTPDGQWQLSLRLPNGRFWVRQDVSEECVLAQLSSYEEFSRLREVRHVRPENALDLES